MKNEFIDIKVQNQKQKVSFIVVINKINEVHLIMN